MVKNVTDRPPVHMKTAHFLPADFENGRFRKRNSNRHIFEMASCKHLKMTKTEHFSRFWNDTDQFLGCLHTYLALKSCNEFLLSNFLPFSNCSGIVWTLTQVLQPSHFSLFSIRAVIVWTQSYSLAKIPSNITWQLFGSLIDKWCHMKIIDLGTVRSIKSFNQICKANLTGKRESKYSLKAQRLGCKYWKLRFLIGGEVKVKVKLRFSALNAGLG